MDIDMFNKWRHEYYKMNFVDDQQTLSQADHRRNTMIHKIKLGDGMEFELTDEQAKFAFRWVGTKGNLIQDPDSMPPYLREIVEEKGDCCGKNNWPQFHQDD